MPLKKHISPKIQYTFRKQGEYLPQLYNRHGKDREKIDAIHPCHNCGQDYDIRRFGDLGDCCVECFAKRRKCKTDGCRNRTIMEEGLCRDCLMGEEKYDYREEIINGRKAGNMAREQTHRKLDKNDGLLEILRAKMREKGVTMTRNEYFQRNKKRT